jgi:dsRNA-specific ribonuclease
VATALYDAYPELSEGYLSRIRADVVSRRSCAHVARVLGLDTMLAERVPEGATLAASTNVAAAVLEAMLGVSSSSSESRRCASRSRGILGDR